MPRIARDLGVFVPRDEAVEVLRALLDAWKEDLRYRVSRVKARMKFMVDDYGPEGIREEVERRLGRTLRGYELPPPGELSDHVGVHPQRQSGLSYVGVPVHLGLVTGERMIAVADLADDLGGDVRVTRQQNFVLTNVPDARVDETVARLAEIGFPLDVNRVRASSIACTGEPHCNFSVTETKPRLDRLVQRLEERFGDDIAGLRLHLDGCPHACAHHWVGDLGFQGTTLRDEAGKRRQAYDVFLRGGLGPRRRDRPAGVPARADRGARRDGRAPRRRLAGRARRRGGLPRVLRPHERRRARGRWSAASPPAHERRRPRRA